jgi:hypothetical protein
MFTEQWNRRIEVQERRLKLIAIVITLSVMVQLS